MNTFGRVILSGILLLNIFVYGYYSLSFASRPDDLPRSAAIIITTISFVGLALFLNQKD